MGCWTACGGGGATTPRATPLELRSATTRGRHSRGMPWRITHALRAPIQRSP